MCFPIKTSKCLFQWNNPTDWDGTNSMPCLAYSEDKFHAIRDHLRSWEHPREWSFSRGNI